MSESASSISPIATISSYDDLLAACRRQVARLGLNYQILDQVAGYGDGYATKLLAHSEYSTTGGRRTKRHFSPQSFDAYLAALGLELVAIKSPAKVAKLKAFCESKYLAREGPLRSAATDCLISFRLSHDFMRRIGRKGALARAQKLRAAASERKRISERNRRNALKRWRRQEITSGPQADPDHALA